MSRRGDEEHLKQDDDARDAAVRRKSLLALAVMAVLVVAGIVVVDRLRAMSAAQDCLMTRATSCNDLVSPIGAGGSR